MYQQETQLYYSSNWDAIFYKNGLVFWSCKYSKFYQGKFPKIYFLNNRHRRQVMTFRRMFFQDTHIHWSFFRLWYNIKTTPQLQYFYRMIYRSRKYCVSRTVNVFSSCTYFDTYKLWKIAFSLIIFLAWIFVS